MQTFLIGIGILVFTYLVLSAVDWYMRQESRKELYRRRLIDRIQTKVIQGQRADSDYLTVIANMKFRDRYHLPAVNSWIECSTDELEKLAAAYDRL